MENGSLEVCLPRQLGSGLIYNAGFLTLSGAADNAAHKIYVWDIVNEGQFAATLDGGREPLLHVHVKSHLSIYKWTNRPKPILLFFFGHTCIVASE